MGKEFEMNRLAWVLTVAALGVGICSWAMAADQPAAPGPQARPQRGGHMMFSGLNLTEDQKAKAKEIMDAARAEAAKATDPKAKGDIMRAAMDKIRTTVLTDEQRQKAEQMMRTRREGRPPGPPREGRRPPGPPREGGPPPPPAEK